MDKNYGGVIWTNHAMDRLKERGISQGDAWATWRSPDQSRPGSNTNGSWVYYKTYGNQTIEVVAKQNERKEWVIMSVWSKPTIHQQKSYQPKRDMLITRLLKKLFKVGA